MVKSNSDKGVWQKSKELYPSSITKRRLLRSIFLFALFYLTGSSSNERNRRDTGSVSLEDVRKEFQTQLSSITASQLCSPPDKICLAGPPGPKGDPGEEGTRGERGESNKTILSSLSFLMAT